MTIELDDIIRQSLTDVSADGLSDDLVIQAAQEAVACGLATPQQPIAAAAPRRPAVTRLIQRAPRG